MHRQRPLQNSMFLPENNSRRQSFDYNPPFNALKKSSTFNGSGDMHQHQYFVSPNHISSVGNTPRPQQREEGRQNIQNKSMEMAIGEINEKMQKLNRLVEKHESQLSGQGSGSGKADELTETVMNKLRQNVPLFSNSNDVYEHIFNIKMEIKDLKDELTKNNRQNEFKNLQTNIKQLISEQKRKFSDKPNESTNLSNELLKKRDEYFQSLIGNLQTELVFLKKHLNNHSLEMKVSPISSSSTIMLKYQEMFKARTKGQTDMIISQHTYYIDNEGHLLDNQSRYLVDQKGKKVKLQEKHQNMLRSQKILQ